MTHESRKKQCWGFGSGAGSRSAESAFFGPRRSGSGSGSLSQRYESGSFSFLIKVLSRYDNFDFS
jgi:hypothetical protein